jgi:lysophospholipase L1-like esterase
MITITIAMVGGLLAISPRYESTARAAGPLYYLNLGDSVAVGHQPGTADGSETLHGYSNRVVSDVASRFQLTLENFGCGGATTASILNSVGCNGGEANNGVSYPSTTQAGAAINFIHAHPGQIGLVTIAIGGNDFNSCLSLQVPGSCLSQFLSPMMANLKTLASRLRAAGGASMPIVAITYTDDTLANWLHGSSNEAGVKDWIAEFRNVINPVFVKAYAISKVTVVDITADFGTYQPLSILVRQPPYGRIPLAVARECTLVWMCSSGDQHPTNAGYALIAREIVKAYLKLAP